MNLGANIAMLRKKRGLSQEKMAEMVGVSRQTIYTWESQAATPNVESLVALARLFAVSTDELIFGNFVSRFPKVLPLIELQYVSTFDGQLTCEELDGWFISPRLNEAVSWAMYDLPDGIKDYSYHLESVGKSKIHDEDGVDIIIMEYDEKNEERHDNLVSFVGQIKEGRGRYLAVTYLEKGVRSLMTYKDDDFRANWGIGKENNGIETLIVSSSVLSENDGCITATGSEPARKAVGIYRLRYGLKVHEVVKVVSFDASNPKILIEHYLDRSGDTLLWRRFDKLDIADRSALAVMGREKRFVNGEPYALNYECITDRLA